MITLTNLPQLATFSHPRSRPGRLLEGIFREADLRKETWKILVKENGVNFDADAELTGGREDGRLSTYALTGDKADMQLILARDMGRASVLKHTEYAWKFLNRFSRVNGEIVRKG